MTVHVFLFMHAYTMHKCMCDFVRQFDAYTLFNARTNTTRFVRTNQYNPVAMKAYSAHLNAHTLALHVGGYIYICTYSWIYICTYSYAYTHTNTHKGAGTHLEVLKNLDNCEWCAGQQAFFRSLQSCLRDNAAFVLGCLRIHISDVVVKIMTVCVAQPLDVLLNRYRVAQVVVHGAA